MAEDTKQASGGNKKDEGEKDDGDEKKSDGSTGGAEGLFSPMGMSMVVIAMIFDITVDLTGDEIFPGWFIEAGIDLLAAIFFTIWMIFTGRKGWWWKVLIALILQLIPYVDNVTFVFGFITMVLGIKFPENWETFVYSVL